MFKKRIGIVILLSMFVFVGVLIGASRAHADNEPAFVVIDALPTLNAGEPFVVTGGLYRQTETGREGIPQRRVDLYIEPDRILSGPITQTTQLAKVYSDDTGRLTWTIHHSLPAGHYRLYFIYEGSLRFSKGYAVTDIVVTGVAKVAKKLEPVRLNVSTLTNEIISGEPFTLSVRLANSSGKALANQYLRVKLPGLVQQQSTSITGTAIFTIKKPLPIGKNIFTIVYAGAGDYERAQTYSSIIVKPPISTTLVLNQNSDTLYVGAENAITAQLVTSNLLRVDAELVRFYVDGTFRYGAITDVAGKTILRLPREILAGTHIVSATFHGKNTLYGTEHVYQITILPRPFEIHTVPPLPEVKIKIGDKIIQTDPQGVARLLVEQGGEMPISVLPYEFPKGSIKARFDRWSDDVFSATRMINVTNGKAYQLGFELSYPIEPLFTEVNTGRIVNPNRLNNIRLLNSAGDILSITATSTQWVKANRIVKRESTLESTPLIYAVQNVTAEGVNVVNEGQQKFEVHPNGQWKVILQMHDLKISAYDALSGLPIGTGAQLLHSSGQLHNITFDNTSQARLESLARGSYTVTISGAYGIRAPMPVSLSQNQDLQVAIISYFDIFIVTVILLTIVLITLAVGRPALFSGLRGASTKARA